MHMEPYALKPTELQTQLDESRSILNAVTTANAIAALRERMAMSQQAFADRLGISIGAISRYEKGLRSPRRPILKKLSTLAESASLPQLRDFFEAKSATDMAARIDNLPSAGSARRVSVQDLNLWCEWLEQADDWLKPILKHSETSTTIPDIQLAREAAGRITDTLVNIRHAIRHYLSPLQPSVTKPRRPRGRVTL